MRLLANENMPGEAVEALRQQGHDVAWIRTDAPGSSDQQVIGRALREQRILLTFDKDFGELVFRSRYAVRGVILFRTSAPSAAHVARVTVTALQRELDWEGHFAVVEDNRIRLRPLLTTSQET